MEQDVTYHRLTEDTAPYLECAEVFDNPVKPDQLDAFVQDVGHELIFARVGEVVLGFASGVIVLHPDQAPVFFLNEVGVEPEWRRRGIASALCLRLIDIARDRGCKGVWLATELGNAPARALYRSLSARETADIVVYDWDGAMDT